MMMLIKRVITVLKEHWKGDAKLKWTFYIYVLNFWDQLKLKADFCGSTVIIIIDLYISERCT